MTHASKEMRRFNYLISETDGHKQADNQLCHPQARAGRHSPDGKRRRKKQASASY